VDSLVVLETLVSKERSVCCPFVALDPYKYHSFIELYVDEMFNVFSIPPSG